MSSTRSESLSRIRSTAILKVFVIVFLMAANAAAEESLNIASAQAFERVLEQSLQKPSISKADVESFYKQAFGFWRDHWGHYLDNPAPYQSILSLYYKNQVRYPLQL